MNLYLTRHAQPVNDGTTDPTLSTFGQAQAVKLGKLFTRLGVSFATSSFLASSLRRTERTANIFAKSLRLAQSPVPAARPIPQFQVTSDAGTLLANVRTVVADEQPTHMFVVWHHPLIGDAFNRLVGATLVWPNLYGATALITCDESLADGSGTFQWFVLPELLP